MSTVKSAGETTIAPSQDQSNSPIQVQGTTSASIPVQVTFKEVVEKIQSGSQQVGFYNNLVKRVEELTLFRKSHNGEALTLTISNDSTEIEFHNLDMILKFLDSAIESGKTSKDKFEVELLNMFA